jgi:hypothetical protein
MKNAKELMIEYTVHQLFFARLVAENGRIKLFREALNTVEVARANVQDSAGLF